MVAFEPLSLAGIITADTRIEMVVIGEDSINNFRDLFVEMHVLVCHNDDDANHRFEAENASQSVIGSDVNFF